MKARSSPYMSNRGTFDKTSEIFLASQVAKLSREASAAYIQFVSSMLIHLLRF